MVPGDESGRLHAPVSSLSVVAGILKDGIREYINQHLVSTFLALLRHSLVNASVEISASSDMIQRAKDKGQTRDLSMVPGWVGT